MTKRVLITGAGGGIGRATARAFADAGADVAICDLDRAALHALATELEAPGRRVIARTVDVADPAAVQLFADVVLAEWGALDVVVNNAGVCLAGGMLDVSLADWEWVIGVNLLGVVNVCHAFVPPMIASGHGGHVINIASIAAFAPSARLMGYATTKAAVLALTYALRDELRRHGIVVTAICPGRIPTGMLQRARLRGWTGTAEAREHAERAFARLRRRPELVAQAVVGAALSKRRLVLVTAEARLLYYLSRLWPGMIETLKGVAYRRSVRRDARRNVDETESYANTP